MIHANCGRAVLAGQAERIPAHPDDEIGLVGTLLVEAVQARGTGKVTVADAYLAPDGCAALDGLGTVLVGQLEMREAATSEVVNRVQPPTGRLAARLAKATAVASTQAASDPTHGRTRSLVRQLAGHHGVQELDRLVEPILHRWIAHLGQAEHRRPGGGLAQRQATRAAGQRQAQQVSATVERTPALDRLGLSGEAVKIESGGKSPQQLFKLIRRERCCVLYLPRIVPTRAGSRAILTPMGVSPPRAPRTVRDTLASYGSRCSAIPMQKAPMRKQMRVGADDPRQPVSCTFGPLMQSLELVARPADQEGIDPMQSRGQLRLVEVAVVVDPALDVRSVHPCQIRQGFVGPMMERPPSDRLPDCFPRVRTGRRQKGRAI